MADHPEHNPSPLQLPAAPVKLPPVGPTQPHTSNPSSPNPGPRPPVDPPEALSYSELTVRIFADRQGNLKGQVIESPLGQSTEFELAEPFEGDQLDELIRMLEGRASSENLQADPINGTTSAATKNASAEAQANFSKEDQSRLDEYFRAHGTQLTASLFPDYAMRYLRFGKEVINKDVRHNSSQGMRLRLVFTVAPGAPGSDKLNRLIATPWDLLMDPTAPGKFLCRSASYAYLPLVYSFGSRVPTRSSYAEIKPPLRVLLVLQSAVNATKDLELGDIVQQIRTAVSGTETVKIDVIAAPKLVELGDKINRENYHVVQFLGHGGVFDESQEGYLYFEHVDKSKNEYQARDIASTLRQSGTIRLVVLGACDTLKTDRDQGRSPFLTVAGALYQNGIPAVVAMRYPISSDAISRFSAELFAAIAAGDPIDTAVTEARASMRTETYEWTTPVLCLDAKDGHIFKLRRLSQQAEDPISLGIASFEGYGAKLTRQSDRVLSFIQNFERQDGTENRYVRDIRLWNEKMFPQLRRFLTEAAHEERPIQLEMQAHLSLAFAAGYILEAKSGLDISVRQRGISGTSLWSVGDGDHGDQEAVLKGPHWQSFSGPDGTLRDETSHNLAVAIGITRPVLGAVESYLNDRAKGEKPLTVRRILSAAAKPEPGQTAIVGGAHAAAMASALVKVLAERPRSETGPKATIHLFAAAPNAFFFFLGQMARGLGQIQLYEYEFDQDAGRQIYRPSMLLSQKIAHAT